MEKDEVPDGHDVPTTQSKPEAPSQSSINLASLEPSNTEDITRPVAPKTPLPRRLSTSPSEQSDCAIASSTSSECPPPAVARNHRYGGNSRARSLPTERHAGEFAEIKPEGDEKKFPGGRTFRTSFPPPLAYDINETREFENQAVVSRLAGINLEKPQSHYHDHCITFGEAIQPEAAAQKKLRVDFEQQAARLVQLKSQVESMEKAMTMSNLREVSQESLNSLNIYREQMKQTEAAVEGLAAELRTRETKTQDWMHAAFPDITKLQPPSGDTSKQQTTGPKSEWNLGTNHNKPAVLPRPLVFKTAMAKTEKTTAYSTSSTDRMNTAAPLKTVRINETTADRARSASRSDSPPPRGDDAAETLSTTNETYTSIPDWFHAMESLNPLNLDAPNDTESRYKAILNIIWTHHNQPFVDADNLASGRTQPWDKNWHEPHARWPTETRQHLGGWWRCRTAADAPAAERTCRRCHVLSPPVAPATPSRYPEILAAVAQHVGLVAERDRLLALDRGAEQRAAAAELLAAEPEHWKLRAGFRDWELHEPMARPKSMVEIHRLMLAKEREVKAKEAKLRGQRAKGKGKEGAKDARRGRWKDMGTGKLVWEEVAEGDWEEGGEEGASWDLVSRPTSSDGAASSSGGGLV